VSIDVDLVLLLSAIVLVVVGLWLLCEGGRS